MKYQKEWDEGYEDGSKGIVERGREISTRLDTASTPEIYYFRGNIVGQLRYIKDVLQITPHSPESIEALRPEDV